MAILKDSIIMGDLDVQGKIQTSTQMDNIDSDIIKVEFAKLINPNNLNEEVVLVEIPTGYVGKMPYPPLITVSVYEDTAPSTSAKITAYYAYIGALSGIYSSSDELTIEKEISTSINIAHVLQENSNIRVKVITKGVGFTSKILLAGTIYLQKI